MSSSSKHYRELVSLSAFGFGAWLLTTFAPMCLFWIKGSLTAPDGASIARHTHLALLDLTDTLIYAVIPGLTSGYLLFALLILRQAQKMRAS
jgi:hypothetical protein